MLLFIVAIRDRAADAFNRPIFVASVGMAIRGFQDEVNRDAADNEMFRHPEDFDLYELGVFDDSVGSFQTQQPRQLAIGKDCKR